MLLAIDIGNTSTSFGLFKDKNLVAHYHCMTTEYQTGEEHFFWLRDQMDMNKLDYLGIKNVILASVVPTMTIKLIEASESHLGLFPLVVGDKNIKLGLSIEVDCPEEVGADRIVNAIAAMDKVKPPAVVIDFGTATTFDVIDAHGNYCGGAISPGIQLSIDALSSKAAKLPDIELKMPDNIIGRNTVDAMRSGLFFGYISLIEGMVDRYRKVFSSGLTVIATGGYASLFVEHTDVIDQVVPELTLDGLRLIFEMNQED